MKNKGRDGPILKTTNQSYLLRLGGDTLACMAEAVENADVMIMCVSKKYQESKSCKKGKRLHIGYGQNRVQNIKKIKRNTDVVNVVFPTVSLQFL